VRSFYRPRWALYLSMAQANATEAAYCDAVYRNVEQPWQMDRTTFPIEPEEDAVQVAIALAQLYAPTEHLSPSQNSYGQSASQSRGISPGHGFVWGTSTAAYQVEGARTADRRQPSVWDAFDTPSVHSATIHAHKPSGAPNVLDNESGAVAADDYVRFADSAEQSRALGFGAVRISVSWSRVMSYTAGSAPSDRPLAWTANAEGIAHYKRVLSAYASQGVRVALTMFHWDTPLPLEEHAKPPSCHGPRSMQSLLVATARHCGFVLGLTRPLRSTRACCFVSSVRPISVWTTGSLSMSL
jgi:hypothetical protein